METIIVNLFGAPGAGKSTGAAYIFSQLKLAGVNAELVTEFAKDKVWEESKEVFNNQIYIFGKQLFKISRVMGKVQVIITDSPILLSSFYNSDPVAKNELDALIHKVFNSHNNMNFFIQRVKPYHPEGRFQTEVESDIVANGVGDMLDQNNVPYATVPGNIQGYDYIVSEIQKQLVCQEKVLN